MDYDTLLTTYLPDKACGAYDEPIVIGRCEMCDCNIYDYEDYYDFEGSKVCEDCVNQAWRSC